MKYPVIEYRTKTNPNKIEQTGMDLLNFATIPDWCDEIRIGKGVLTMPKGRNDFYGEYVVQKLDRIIYICEHPTKDEITKFLNGKEKLNVKFGKFSDGNIYELENKAEIVDPKIIAQKKEDAMKADEEFSKRYDLPLLY